MTHPAHLYQAYYCEENAWQLVHKLQENFAPTIQPDEASPGYVALISNPTRSCALWLQRAAPSLEEAIVWDYHVIVLWKREAGWEVWDLDTHLEMPIAAEHYFALTFAGLAQWPAQFRPYFRLFGASEYIETLSTDRSHMLLEDGSYRRSPPPWEPPFQQARGMNLMALVDVENTAAPGLVLSYDELMHKLALA